MTIKPPYRIALVAALAALVLVLVPTALAGKPGGHSCTRNAPSVSTENTWAWGSPGSWGMPGQQLSYQLRVVNNDAGCSSSSFVIGMSAPSGFSVSMPTNTISLKSTTSGYLWAYVTSPSGAADGDYPLSLTAQRAASPAGSSTSYYKVYSSDTVAPRLFWSNPTDGQTISGGSYNFAVWSNDDHEVRRVDLYIDDVYTSTTQCEDISYNCQGYYPLSLRGLSGQHTATFESYDWMGNVGVLTVNFTVS